MLCNVYIGVVDPKVLLELFSMYREWQEENVKKLSQKQVCYNKMQQSLLIMLSSNKWYSISVFDFKILVGFSRCELKVWGGL